MRLVRKPLPSRDREGAVATLAALLLLAGCTGSHQPASAAPAGPPIVTWKPAIVTQPVADDPDDPAIWIHPSNPSLSLVIGTNKVAAPAGALVVFDLQGKILQTISGIDRPNNVDLRQGVQLGDRTLDIVAVTERYKSTLRFYSIDADTRSLTQIGAAPVFEGETGDRAAPMGIALYKRPADQALFAIVGRKSGPLEGYLWQYRVGPGPSLNLARKFGKFSGSKEIEAVVADDENGCVYYSDEGAGIRKYYADPEKDSAELALFGTTGYRGDREGLAIYGDYLVSTDQIESGSRYLLYRRAGSPSNPHDQSEVVAIIEGGAAATDGIEATSTPLGPAFPNGLLVAMNSGPKNFLYFAWSPIPPH